MSKGPADDNILESPEIAGLLYKRRGGFGKIMPNAWQYRFFLITKEGILLYFDTTEVPEEGYSESRARGRLDLRSLPYDLNMDFIEGAPTQFYIQIAIPNEEKWKLCAETKEDQNRWYKVLEKFNVDKAAKIARSLNYTSDDDAAGLQAGAMNRRGSSFSPRGDVAASKAAAAGIGTFMSTSLSPIVTSGKMTAEANNTQQPTPIPKTNANASATAPPPAAAAQAHKKRTLRSQNKQGAGDSRHLYETIMVLCIVNICIWGVVQAQGIVSLLINIAVCNVVVYHTLTLRLQRSQNSSATASATSPSAELSAAAAHSSQATTSAPAVPEAAPAVATSAAVSANNKPIAGSTMKEVSADDKDAPAHTWSKADPRLFSVRIGPDYNRNKKKAPSGPAIYECVAFDVFCTKKRVDHVATRMELPDTTNMDTHNPHVPPLLIIQIQIPSEPPPSLFTTVEDGPGWALVMYYRITEDSLRQLRDLSTAQPHIKLFSEWCEKAPTDAAWRGRFKVICLCTNFEELGFPSMITQYNGKPVLIRRTGTIFKDPANRYLEMNIHVHKFATMAKQSIYMLTSRAGSMNMNIGFVIEGREDKELPETLFACCSVSRPQEEQAEFIFEDE